MNILVVIAVVVVVLGLGGGGMAWLYFATRPKKVSWVGEIYRCSESTFKCGGAELSKLNFVGVDVLEKVEHESGKTIYRLVGLNRTTPSPSDDTILKMPDGKERVRVLLDGENATLLKSGYDVGRGLEVFNPVPYDRINLIQNNIQVKKDRLRKEKDILTAITPWIVIGISMLGFVAMSYFMAGGYVKASDAMLEMDKNRLAHESQMAEYNRETMLEFRRELDRSYAELEDFGESQVKLVPSIE